MANNLKVIPASAFYTAMPQLVSRVIHVDKDTAYVVQGILKRVLVKFPQQAMWPLAWLKGSKKPERLQIGEEIFKEEFEQEPQKYGKIAPGSKSPVQISQRSGGVSSLIVL
jgi:hypothetical protein